MPEIDVWRHGNTSGHHNCNYITITNNNNELVTIYVLKGKTRFLPQTIY